MNKKILIVGAIAASALFFAGCTDSTSTYQQTQSQTESIQAKLVKDVPIPQLTQSSERKNVAARAQLFDNENKVSYIYLLSYGKVMAFYTVKGKVSSLRSYLTPSQQIVNSVGVPCTTANDGSYSGPGCGSGAGYTVDSPDIDGTYGENVAGIFFFTTDGVYVEWNGEYMMSDQPLQLTTQPELVRTIK